MMKQSQEQKKSNQRAESFLPFGNFEYLIHGGRIGKVAGVAAKTLGIKPLIVLRDGEIFASGVTRGREKSKRKIIENTIKHFHEKSS